jgi:DNA polymerase-1
MQGTAADIIKLAMIKIDRWLREARGQVRAVLMMQVHDELVFEVAEADVPQAAEKIKHYMAVAEQLDVPLLAEVGVGDNWQEAHP